MVTWHQFEGDGELCEACNCTQFGGFHPPAATPKSPHTYTPSRKVGAWEWSPCKVCRQGPGHPVHLYTLPGMERLAQYRIQSQEEAKPEEPKRVDTSKTMELFG